MHGSLLSVVLALSVLLSALAAAHAARTFAQGINTAGRIMGAFVGATGHHGFVAIRRK